MTYKQIVDTIVAKMATHKMVKESIYSLRWEVNELAKPGRKYFLSVLVPTTSTNEGELINTGFQLIVMDIISKTENNKLQIQSDSMGIIQDFYNFIKNDDTIAKLPTVTLTVFEENFGDFCAGAGMEFTVQVPNSGSCDLPFN